MGRGYTLRGTPITFGLGKGTPDLVGHDASGRAMYVDAKRPKDKLSQDQRAFLEAAAARGAHAVELRDVEAFDAWLATCPEPAGELITL